MTGSQTRQLLRSSALVVAFALILHLGWSAAVALGTRLYYVDRIFNIHRLKDSHSEGSWASAYIHDMVSDADVVAAGSSFTFLYPYDESDTYTAELNRRGVRTVNVSATSYGMRAIYNNILCPIRDQRKVPSALIIEIGLINEVVALRSNAETGTIASCPPKRNTGLFEFALMHPNGAAWATIMQDQFAQAHPGDQISLGSVPDDYLPTFAEYLSVEQRIAWNVERVFTAARAITPNVIMFVTPVYFDGIAKVGRDPEQTRPQFERVSDICNRVAGERCLDTRSLLDVANFANITHFNRVGAHALAAKLYDKLAAPPQPLN